MNAKPSASILRIADDTAANSRDFAIAHSLGFTAATRTEGRS